VGAVAARARSSAPLGPRPRPAAGAPPAALQPAAANPSDAPLSGVSQLGAPPAGEGSARREMGEGHSAGHSGGGAPPQLSMWSQSSQPSQSHANAFHPKPRRTLTSAASARRAGRDAATDPREPTPLGLELEQRVVEQRHAARFAEPSAEARAEPHTSAAALTSRSIARRVAKCNC